MNAGGRAERRAGGKSSRGDAEARRVSAAKNAKGGRKRVEGWRKGKRNERGRECRREMARERAVFPARGAAGCRTPGSWEMRLPAALGRLPSIAIGGRRKGRGPTARRGRLAPPVVFHGVENRLPLCGKVAETCFHCVENREPSEHPWPPPFQPFPSAALPPEGWIYLQYCKFMPLVLAKIWRLFDILQIAARNCLARGIIA